ncbi:uncharacterized protein LOC115059221 [Echeneis naucrates]|uniref:uncharacterized protein LOC115059221 n=1 Tax=Echeneis naucrates TaxID=173247 RepID=UPI001113BFA6|nr:uncharacterized protein LOC115059221 [Echeneis naucrates]
MPGPSVESAGQPAGDERNHPNFGALEKFAQTVAENIIQSFINQMEMVEPEMCASNQDPETLAEELASAVVEIALREVCGGCVESFRPTGGKTDEEQNENQAFSEESGGDRDCWATNTELDPVRESRDIHLYQPPLSHSGLPIMGSLDYPDAPPTTPLLPELQRGRQSFARKLKGGLAKVFLPSPPPPTPKDKDDNFVSINNQREELMEQLMHSLSTDDLARDSSEVGAQPGAKIETFAKALSCDIMDWVLSAKSREQTANGTDLNLLAQQLAETIISSSLDEAKRPSEV